MSGEKFIPNKRLPVLQEDIEEGIRRNQYNCAIACAINRVIPDAVRVRVNKKMISYTIGEERIYFPTPKVAIEAIIEPFDTGGKPEPVTLNLQGGISKPLRTSNPEKLLKERIRYRSNKHHGIVSDLRDNPQSRSDYLRFTDDQQIS